MPASPTVHATCFVIDGQGILLRGASGAGKSRLALHFIETAPVRGRQARLVGDDRVYLEPVEGRLIASVPSAIAGLIERRSSGLRDAGIERIDWQPSAPVGLVVDILDDDAEIVIPSKNIRHIRLEGVDLPYLPVPRDFQAAVALIEAILPQLPPV
ncbi:HPr kinase/phosphatase C-terminal domain-containing protein [Labrys sp. ZIDIC5]|uniref:HPr kinase/phosphorylase n=1 Tax=Labrys sedimenti TaxID=3106036 RepID=UPI002ACAB3D2|nr:HPr kinase/phosphatase C-terminal domain-containing protein [Labrys sp. ZIDIC5]MDZ5450735.1 HPr kinase/phosphatase C-terminal domain-containing protein [Labrys sp. ZIDIC5]